MSISDGYLQDLLKLHRILAFLIVTLNVNIATAQQTKLANSGVAIIPYPKEVELTGSPFIFDKLITIVLDKDVSVNDQFAADELCKYLSVQAGIKCAISKSKGERSIVLTRKGADKKYGEEGYSL